MKKALITGQDGSYLSELKWDATKPDGMYRKLMDSSRAHALGWKPESTLDEGIARTIAEYRASLQ